MSDEQKNSLLKQIDDTDFEIIKHSRENKHAETKGVISPISVMTIDEIEKEKKTFKPSELGKVVSDLMVKFFDKIFEIRVYILK